MSADRQPTDERIAAIAAKYTSTGERAKIPLMICVASGRTSSLAEVDEGFTPMRKLILGVAPASAPVLVAAPAADALSYSRLFPQELDPIPVSGHEAQQPD